MNNNRVSSKYIVRDPPPGPSKMCYPFSGNPVQYGGTFKNIDGVNGYMLCNSPKLPGCKTCSEWVDKENVGCILEMTNSSPEFCVTSSPAGPISTGGCKNLPISGPGSDQVRSKIECLGSSSTPAPGPAPGPSPPGPTPGPAPPGPTPGPGPSSCTQINDIFSTCPNPYTPCVNDKCIPSPPGPGDQDHHQDHHQDHQE